MAMVPTAEERSRAQEHRSLKEQCAAAYLADAADVMERNHVKAAVVNHSCVRAHGQVCLERCTLAIACSVYRLCDTRLLKAAADSLPVPDR